ncbi:MAG: response regulator transcription factor [Peptococcaceae bacterium]|nr:response regulator transcription factor [Peptococcaceae bacterium]MBT9137380.1 Transcriptional regulatory protein WalR [Bacillota bacterium]MBT9157937.1 Transcriptional regulatory protein WalR [Bacillota bacterium]
MSPRILVVEDEKPIAEIVKFNLEREGFSVELAFNGRDALDMAIRQLPDLVILDVMLPKLDGFQVLTELRRTTGNPILMLTAKEGESDKVRGLELGADDYITKPFSPRELVARVKAHLRRAQLLVVPGEKDVSSLLCDRLVIDLVKYEVRKGGQPIELTVREFELLKYLALNRGRVFDREHLLKEVWGYNYFGDGRTVDVTIRRLREKIEDDPSANNAKYVLTRRGVGYYFRELDVV